MTSRPPDLTPPPPATPTLRLILTNRGFVACALLLLTFTVAFEVLAKVKDIQFRKLPVPLRKPLNLLDQSALCSLVFSLPAELGGHLYAGPPAPAVTSAFAGQGITLGANARVEVRRTGTEWLILDQNEQTRLDVAYTIRHDPAARRLDVYAPYRLLSAVDIKAEILDGLGTDQYIQWMLLDQSRMGTPRPEDFIQLFVTYYTGAPDQVPHVPEECYIGGGFHVVGESFLDVPVPALGPDVSVRFKVLEFQGSSYNPRGAKLVLYVFHTNGRFCADRHCVRAALADPFDRHAYFSKLEVSFGTSEALPARENALDAGRRFLAAVIPVLIEDHWPDWDQVVRSERQSRTAETTTAN